MNLQRLYFLVSLLMMLALPIHSNATATASSQTDSNSDETTVIEERTESGTTALKTPGLISLYHPNYVLPFYHTNSPYYQIYLGNTPNNQKLDKNEFKAQLSFLVPIVRNKSILQHPLSLNMAYTQLMYWQVYAKSQYFRETNYEPELFALMILNPNTEIQLGFNHQSNGRGGSLERSWNRMIAQLTFSSSDWLARFKVWTLIAQSKSSDIHNPDIARFLGYGNLLLSYKWNDITISGEAQNIESAFKRGFITLSASLPISTRLSVYVQFFNGYGQSLIEYNHRTSSAGIGISLNDIIN